MIRTATKTFAFDRDSAKRFHHAVVADVESLCNTGRPVDFWLACVVADKISRVRDYLLSIRRAARIARTAAHRM